MFLAIFLTHFVCEGIHSILASAPPEDFNEREKSLGKMSSGSLEGDRLGLLPKLPLDK